AHNWHSWSASANAGGEHSLVRDPGFHGTLGSLNGELSSSYLAGYDSHPSSAFHGLALDAARQRDHLPVELSAPPLSSEDSNRSRHPHERVAGLFGLSRCPWSVPLGVSLSSAQQFDFEQVWASADHVDVSPPFEQRQSNNRTAGLYDVIVRLDASMSVG